METNEMARRLTETDRKEIISRKHNEPTASNKDIAGYVDRSPSTVAKVIKEAKKRGVKFT